MLTEALFVLMLHLEIDCSKANVNCRIFQTPDTVIVESCVEYAYFRMPHTPSIRYRATLPDGRTLQILELDACRVT